ncbi:MAG: hypothetical protein II727_00415 [Oscillospiraceae bacterium]|nr:hypothetical protein [Oscillospiraceae bacterium]
MRYAAGGLALLFLFALLCLLLRIYLESRREREKPAEIPGDELPPALREAALQPLRRLAEYYLKRDPEQADACMEETMLPDDMLILGTNPLEIFRGREGARNLLQGDWRSWGLASLDADGTALGRAGDTLHFVMRGQIRLDFFHIRVPIKITGLLIEKDGAWRIGKLQFVNDLNTNYVIIAWIPAIVLTANLVLFLLFRLLGI